ncbi:MAG TPA: MerR family transcriptional regulator [Gammaproteobacteria bacterium]|nr:MerR family transcriptional regulator [Gammaproteobacteria bacterium]
MIQTYGIRELRREFGVTARTLRHYEDKGLIKPIRQGVTRRFSERDRVRLGLTVRGRRLGFSLDEIKEIIDMYNPLSPNDQSQILLLCSKIEKYRSLLINKINDISDTLKLMDDVEKDALGTLEQIKHPG